jgi:hypothetical protein
LVGHLGNRSTGPNPNAGWTETWSGASSLGTSATSPASLCQLNALIIAFKVNLRNYIRGIALVGHIGNDQRVQTPMLDEPRTWSGATSLGTSATSPTQYINYMFWFIAFKVNLRNYIRRIALVGHIGNDRLVQTPMLDEPRTWSGATSLGTSATLPTQYINYCTRATIGRSWLETALEY